MFLCSLSCLLSESFVFVIHVHGGRRQCERDSHSVFFLTSQSKLFSHSTLINPTYQLQFMLSITHRSPCFPEALSNLAVVSFAISSSPDLVDQNILSTQKLTNRSTKVSKTLSSTRSSSVTPREYGFINSHLRDQL
jgi:hypothetical protein